MQNFVYFACLLLLASFVHASSSSKWGYSGEEGPDNWVKLSADYSACAGSNQSPVDLTGFIEADLEAIEFDYKPGGHEILNNGHTIQINYAAGSSIVVDGTKFELKQFHFHAPSENLIKGKSYPMEAHLVHADSNGNLAVVAVMFEAGGENQALAKAWAQMPDKAGINSTLNTTIAVDDVLPSVRDHYRFNGSLTTPPCSEGVRWLVLKKSIPASMDQIEQFAHAIHHPNNRPIQATNARLILK